MFKLLFTASMAAAQDQSKCLEYDFTLKIPLKDNDCCAIKNYAWCDKKYMLEWSDDTCYKGADFTAHKYSCFNPDRYNGGDHDASKCRHSEKGKNPSCCAEGTKGSCADKYAIQWDDKVCDWTTPTWSFEYKCLPRVGKAGGGGGGNSAWEDEWDAEWEKAGQEAAEAAIALTIVFIVVPICICICICVCCCACNKTCCFEKKMDTIVMPVAQQQYPQKTQQPPMMGGMAPPMVGATQMTST